MPIQRTGVEAVVQGFSKFISDLGKIQKGYANLGAAAVKAAAKFQSASHAMQQSQTRAANAQLRAQQATDNYIKSLTKLGAQSRAITAAQASLAAAQKKFAKDSQQVLSAQNQLQKLQAKTPSIIAGVTTAYRSMQAAINNAKQAQQNILYLQTPLAAAQSKYNQSIAFGTQVSAAFGIALKGLSAGFKLLWSAILGVLGVLQLFINIITGGIGAIFSFAKSIGNVLWGAFKKLIGVVHNAIDAVGDFVKRALEVAAGILFVDMIRDVASSLSELRDELLNTIGEFQKLQIQFEVLTARDIAKEQMIPLGQAMGQAAQRAQELFAWAQRMAITTPVGMQDIASSLALANAFGMATDEAKALTKSTIDFASAMGLTNDTVWRIIYNFGQMVNIGKLTGREFRDLAVSFVPIHDILADMAEEAGMKFDEFYKKALSGGVEVKEFIKRFVKFVNENFEGAAQRMLETWPGVLQLLQDFKEQILAWEVFGPVVDRFTKRASNALQQLLQSPAFLQGAHLIGEVLLVAVKNVATAVEQDLIPALSRLTQRMGVGTLSAHSFSVAIMAISITISRFIHWLSYQIDKLSIYLSRNFSTIAKNAVTWGRNIITALASGMVAGMRVLAGVMKVLASFFSGFLKGHSPPRLLPDLPQWGQKAMEEYLRGFTQANFDILESMQDPIEQIFSMFVSAGQMSDLELAQRYADVSKILADALSQGTISDKSLSQIAAAAGEFGDEIVKLINLQLQMAGGADKLADAEEKIKEAEEGVAKAEEDLAKERAVYEKYQDAVKEKDEEIEHARFAVADATEAVEDAEASLDEARKREEASRAEMTNAILAYNDAVREGASETKLVGLRAQVNAAEEMAQRAYEQRIAAEGIVDQRKAEKEALDDSTTVLEREYEAMQDQLDVLDAQVEASQARVDQAEALVDQAEAYRDLIEEQNDAMQKQVDLQKNMIDQLIAITEKFIISPETGGGKGEDALENFEWPPFDLGGAGAGWTPEDVSQEILDIFDEATKIVNDTFATEKWVAGFLGGRPYLKKTPLGEIIDEFSSAWGEIEKSISEVSSILGDMDISVSLTGLITSINKIDWNGLATSAERFGEALMGKTVWAAVPGPHGEPYTNVGQTGGLMQLLDSIKGVGADLWDAMTNAFTAMGESAKAGDFAGVTDFLTKATDFVALIDSFMNDPLSTAWTVIKTVAGDMLKEFQTFFKNVDTEQANFYTRYTGEWYRLETDLVGDSIIPDMMQAIYDAIDTKLGETSERTKAILDLLYADWKTKWGDIAKVVDDTYNLDGTGIVSLAETGTETAKTKMSDEMALMYIRWNTDWGDIAEVVDTTFNAEGTGIVPVVGTAIESVIKKFTDKDGFNETINNVTSQVLVPLKTGFNDVKAAMDKVINTIPLLINAVNNEQWKTALALLDPFLHHSLPPLAQGFYEVADAFDYMSGKFAKDIGLGHSTSDLVAQLVSLYGIMGSMPNIGTTGEIAEIEKYLASIGIPTPNYPSGGNIGTHVMPHGWDMVSAPPVPAGVVNNIGPVYISDNMSQAEFVHLIDQAVARAIMQ